MDVKEVWVEEANGRELTKARAHKNAPVILASNIRP